MDVGTAKAIDGLLRIANQVQSTARLPRPDGREDLVLNGVGVLKLIDQCHRELATNLLCKSALSSLTKPVSKQRQQVREAPDSLNGLVLWQRHPGLSNQRPICQFRQVKLVDLKILLFS